MNNSHFQRLEKLIAKELSRNYKIISTCKTAITANWEKAKPDENTKESNHAFYSLNYFRDMYRTHLDNIKKLEEIQRGIRKILRK